MKVLKPGGLIPKTAEVVCSGNGSNNNGCGATLEIESSDIEMMGSGMDNYDSEPCIECPVCKAVTIVTGLRLLTKEEQALNRDG